ncbi:RNA methyltransferase [Ulvibacterium sp.]|uniref:TrmH family RNA methyltransferase n=1 Tax=Ulvibacterium sp. TaxID=2665914 RepID=UPI002618C9A7|nr:RNA methyltransferase [Ulvibacterium sp.]
MNQVKQINSVQNPLVKRVLALKDKSRERRKTGLFVLEGKQEVELAMKGKYELDTLLIHPDFCNDEVFLRSLESVRPRPDLVSISNEIYKKLAYRETTEGILAIARDKSHTLDDLVLSNENPFILIAEAPEKPGNIGALLRTADAANLDAVIIANPKTDIYNPNIIRSSVGTVFTNQIATGSTADVITFLKKLNIFIICAALTASRKYTLVDFTKPSALVVGTEATGLSREWLEHSHQNILIPMAGQIDSLNVSVSAAILIFEGLRQRGF